MCKLSRQKHKSSFTLNNWSKEHAPMKATLQDFYFFLQLCNVCDLEIACGCCGYLLWICGIVCTHGQTHRWDALDWLVIQSNCGQAWIFVSLRHCDGLSTMFPASHLVTAGTSSTTLKRMKWQKNGWLEHITNMEKFKMQNKKVAHRQMSNPY